MDTWTNEGEKEICIDQSLVFELRPFLHLFMDRKTNRFSENKQTSTLSEMIKIVGYTPDT